MELETEIRCVREATWIQSHGSLDNTLIFSTQNPPDDSEIESCPLILTPPSHSRPCEITIKFEGSLCEVSSIYVRSTARIFELYNKSEINSDNEYICTARGDLAMQEDDQNSVNVCTSHGDLSTPNDDLNLVNVCTAHGELYRQNDDNNSVGGTIIKDDSSSFVGDSCTGTNSYSSTSSPIEIGTQTFLTLEESECDGESSVYQSQSDSNNENSDKILQNFSPKDSIRVSVEIPKSESHCSDEDSWVEVKLSGSLVEDSPGKSGSMSGLESSGSQDSVGKTVKQLGKSATNSEKEISEHNSIDVSQEQLKCIEGAFFQKNATEEKLSSIRVSNPLTECKVEMKARSEGNSAVLSRNSFPKKALYEATVEIVNATPCVSLTIRLLSLQDKSFVEIDAICIYGQGISVAKDRTENIGMSNSSLQGSPFGGSLLAMLIPSMLQMSRGGSNECRDGSFYNFGRDKGIPQLESYEAGSSRSDHQPSSPLSLKEVEASRGGDSSSYTVSGKVVSAELPVVEEKPAPCLDNVGDNLELKNILNKSTQNMLSSVVATDNTCISGRQNELGSENSYMRGMIGTHKIMSSRMDGLYNEEPEKQYSHEDLESNMIDNLSCKKINGENMLEHLCKRMDTLEALCMQIESYVRRSFNTMERRLQLIESFQMMQNHTVMTKMENETIHSGLPVVSNSFSSSSASGMETPSNVNLKHISAVDTPRSCLVSSSDCSPSCTIVNPTALLSGFSCMDVPKDSKSDNIDSLECVEKPSNDDFDKPPNLELDDSTLRNLDQHDLLEEEQVGNKDSPSVEHIEEYAGTEVSIKAVGEHQTTTNKLELSLEDALASALSAFSTSVRPVQLETCTFTEIPSCSSQTEYAHENEGFNDIFLSSQVEITGLCTGVPSGSVEPDASSSDEEQICYHDDTVNLFQGVRYISQESMDSATYSCSQGSQDVKQIVYRGRKITDAQGGLSFTIGRSCCAGTETVVNLEKENMLLEHDNEHKLHDNEIMLNNNVFNAVQINQTTTICGDEVDTVHDCQEQFWPLQECYDIDYSELVPKPTKHIFGDQKMVVDETYLFNLSPGNSEIQVVGTEGTTTGLEIREKQDEIIVVSDSFTESDEHAPRNMHIDFSSFLDVSFTASSTSQTDLLLESLLYDYTPKNGRETISVQKTIEAETLSSAEPKHPHELFFVEDEGLGDLIATGTSSLLSSVTPCNTSNQGIIPELSLGFDSLI